MKTIFIHPSHFKNSIKSYWMMWLLIFFSGLFSTTIQAQHATPEFIQIFPGTTGSNPNYLTNLDINISGVPTPVIFFGAKQSLTVGFELYYTRKGIRTNPTNYVLVRNINAGNLDSYPRELLKHSNGVGTYTYCFATQGANGRVLCRANGSGGLFTFINNIYTSGNSQAEQLTSVGNKLFFSATNPVNNQELWWSDGKTAAEGGVTGMVATPSTTQINTSGASTPQDISSVSIGGIPYIFCSATDGVNGREAWFGRADIATPTVEMLNNNNPVGDANPKGFISYQNLCYFFSTTDALIMVYIEQMLVHCWKPYLCL
jgi:hypothetical protein